MKLTDFSQATDQEYNDLKQKIDELPAGRSFQFERCIMPAGCVPPHVTVGLYKISERYAVYLDKPVQYSGHNQSVQNLCRGRPVLFQNFEKLKQFLCLLLPDEDDSTPANQESPAGLSETTISVVDYKAIQRDMEKHIMGQTAAVETIAHQTALYLNKSNPRKPLSIVTFGPPGTGKSETAKVLSKVLSKHNTHKYATVWTELNTFSEAHSVYRLTGAPPGYVGYNDTPVFEAVAHNPYTIFLFDELDKAHPNVLKTFMSILDEGRCAARKELPDHSREYNFRHCIFIFTSNFCLASQKKIGFSSAEDISNIRIENGEIEVDYNEPKPEQEAATLTKRIYRDTEAARKAFVKTGVLREIASRFNCFVEFKELDTDAKTKILIKQVVETGLEYGIRLRHISSAVMQPLTAATTSEGVLTVRSFKSVIEGCLANAFAEAGMRFKNQSVKLEGTLETPIITPIVNP